MTKTQKMLDERMNRIEAMLEKLAGGSLANQQPAPTTIPTTAPTIVPTGKPVKRMGTSPVATIGQAQDTPISHYLSMRESNPTQYWPVAKLIESFYGWSTCFTDAKLDMRISKNALKALRNSMAETAKAHGKKWACKPYATIRDLANGSFAGQSYSVEDHRKAYAEFKGHPIVSTPLVHSTPFTLA